MCKQQHQLIVHLSHDQQSNSLFHRCSAGQLAYDLPNDFAIRSLHRAIRKTSPRVAHHVFQKMVDTRTRRIEPTLTQNLGQSDLINHWLLVAHGVPRIFSNKWKASPGLGCNILPDSPPTSSRTKGLLVINGWFESDWL